MRTTEMRRYRAMLFINHRATTGDSIPATAKKFGVSAPTVEREVKWAHKIGLLENAEQQIIESLVPKALEAVRAALENGNAKIAIAVLKGMDVLKTPSQRKPEPTSEDEDVLEIYLRKRTPSNLSSPTRPQGALPGGPETAIDAEFFGPDEEGEKALVPVDGKEGVPEGDGV